MPLTRRHWRALALHLQAQDGRQVEIEQRLTELTLAVMDRDEHRDDLIADTVDRVDAFERQLADIAEHPDSVVLAMLRADLRALAQNAAPRSLPEDLA
jgi:hypothetical protein